MNMEIQPEVQEYFLAEYENGEHFPLVKQYGSTGFQRSSNIGASYKFKTEEEAKKACQIQNMLNQMFGSTVETHYFLLHQTRTAYNELGEAINNEEEQV